MNNKIKFDWTVRVDTVVLFATMLISVGVFYANNTRMQADIAEMKVDAKRAEAQNTVDHLRMTETLSRTAGIIDTHLKNGNKL